MARIIDDSGSETKLILDPHPDELETLERAADSWDREIAFGIQGRCGCRAHEVPSVRVGEWRWSDSADSWFAEVRGKDTTGGERKTREVWVPDQLMRQLQRFASERGLETGDPVIDVSTSTIRRWVHETAAAVDDDPRADIRHVDQLSSHDLRRSWVTYHLVERGADVRTMMAIGGWSSYQAIEPYLGAPTDSKIGRVMASTD